MRQLLLVLFVGFVVAFPAGCASAMEPRGSISAPKVDKKIALAFSAASTVLALADAAETTWLDSLAHPTDAQLASSSARVAKLTAVRDVLERVRQHLDGDVSTDLRQVLDDLSLLVSEAPALGVKIPPEAASALSTAKGLLQ